MTASCSRPRGTWLTARLTAFACAFLLLSLVQLVSTTEAQAQSIAAGLYIVIVPQDTADVVAIDTIAIRSWLRRMAQVDDSTAPGGGGMALAAFIDSINVIFTGTSGRLLHISNLQPGTADDQFITTASGATIWTATPNLPRSIGQIFYSGNMNPQNAADTSGNKHVLSITALDREYPIAQGATWSEPRISIHIRGGDAVNGYVYNVYASTITQVAGGWTNVASGDKIILRFFPKNGTGTDKVLRVYRIPSGLHVFGPGANLVYGEEIGYVTIPAANFPTTGDVNVIANHTYKAK